MPFVIHAPDCMGALGDTAAVRTDGRGMVDYRATVAQ